MRRDAVELHVPALAKTGSGWAGQPLVNGGQNAARPVGLQAHLLDVDAAVLDDEEAIRLDEVRERAERRDRRLVGTG